MAADHSPPLFNRENDCFKNYYSVPALGSQAEPLLGTGNGRTLAETASNRGGLRKSRWTAGFQELGSILDEAEEKKRA